MAATVAVVKQKPEETTTVVYEHPLVVRIAHWLNAVALLVMIGSGLRIFLAFPSFGPRIPQQNFFVLPPRPLTIGGWLGGALQWHFTFMWIFVGSGLLYVVYQIVTGHWRQVLFLPRDVKGLWPMARHYFLFSPKPVVDAAYNPLQKLAYTSTIFFGVVSTLTGIVMYKPAQFWWLAWPMGGYHFARSWHFFAMLGFVAFIPGHLLMVAIHGWNNFYSMITGWKREPEYLE
ncbi:MAG: cytochrome b/b6 domain-containing protein [Acidobacteriota bacterium]|nr:cytochrome b/b6 domain-containing protein [Acidobacteriota bacterium]